MQTKYIKAKLLEIAEKNERGYIDFYFAPVIKDTETTETVIKGMIVIKDEIYKKTFSPRILIITYDKNDTSEDQNKSTHEIFKIDISYDDLIKLEKGVIAASNYSQLAIVDLLRLLENDLIIARNLANLQQKSIMLEQII